LILAIVCFYTAQYIFKKTFGKFFIAIKDRIFGEPKAENEASSKDFYKELMINPLTDANNKAIQERDMFLERGANKFNCKDFEKYRNKEEVQGKSFEAYQQILNNRVIQIDAVINDHLRFTRTELEFEREWKNREQPEKLE
jgi:hypothetical protein